MRTHLDLFSGIGGFALAASWAGFKTIGFCENEDFPRRLLSRRFPGVPIHGDIRELDGSIYRGVSLITGGFPCQPFSVSGKQAGTEDDRYLWPEMLRVVAQAQPAWVVAENVTGIIGMALDQVLSDLEGEGYACGTVVLTACAVDAPHRRDRVWIIAKNVGNPTSGRGSAYRSQSGSGTERMGERQTDRFGSSGPHVAYAKGNRLQGCRTGNQGSEHSEEVGQRTAESIGAGPGSSSRDVAHTNSNSAQGLESGAQPGRHERSTGLHGGAGSPPSPDWWEVEPAVGRVANGIPNRMDRLKGLGNAIVPQVAYEILRLLTEK